MATVKTNTDVFEKAWEGFKGTDWKEKASVSRFVQANYTPYDGDESFLAGPTERSLKIKKIIDLGIIPEFIIFLHPKITYRVQIKKVSAAVRVPAIFQKTTN